MDIFDEPSIKNVLAIFAHPDDAETACGGTLAKYADRSCEVNLITVCRGDKGKGGVEVRDQESLQAGKILGLSSIETLGFLDGEFDNDLALRKLLTEKIRFYKPDLIICPDPTAVFFFHSYINHRDHRQVGWAVLDVVSGAVANDKYFSASKAHDCSHLLCAGTLEPNCVVEIDDFQEVKISAVLSYESQISSNLQAIKVSLNNTAENVGKAVGVQFGEAFRYSSLRNSSDQI